MPVWHTLEKALRQLASSYGFQEIRLPTMEYAALFTHNIGEATDIVGKEMYRFEDRNGEWICLRPEGTASCVRAAIELGLPRTPGHKL